MLSAEVQEVLAICVLSAAGAGIGGWIAVLLRRSPFTPAQSLLYALNYLIVRVLWRAEIRGSFPIPTDRGAVIVCNHRCPLDPSLIAIIVPRAVHWMVAREYCEFPPFRRLLQMCEVIPVRRGRMDMAAIREAIRLVRKGELVGVFPEGRINTTANMLLPSRPGAALIALKADAPILSCHIHGAPYDGTTLGCLLMPAHVRLTIGEPTQPTACLEGDGEHETLEELTRRALRQIARLGGQADFEPELAGRLGKAEL